MKPEKPFRWADGDICWLMKEALWIAVESIKAAIAATEGRGRDTALVVEICEWFGVKFGRYNCPWSIRIAVPDRVGVLAEHLAKTLGRQG